MKTITFLFGFFLSLSLLAQNNCGVTVDFDYTIIDNEIHFTNLTQSSYAQVNIAGYSWEFSDGSFSTDTNPIYTIQSPCDLTVCLFAYADSSNLGQEYCNVLSHCTTIQTSSDPLTVWVDYTIDEGIQTALMDYGASGGTAPYEYTFEVDGMSWWVDELDSIYFYSFNAIPVVVCATDANGCSSCDDIIIDNSFMSCTLDLNSSVDGNLLTISAELAINGMTQYEHLGYLDMGQDSISFLIANIPYSAYLPAIGTYEICYELNSFSQEYYPICPASICEEITVTELNSDCQAEFTLNQYQNNVSFYNMSSGFYDELLWDFENGEWSNEEHPLVTFAPGVYTTTLTVSNSLNGCQSVYSETFEVFEDIQLCVEVFNDLDRDSEWDTNEPYLNDVVVDLGNYYWELDTGLLVDSIYPESYLMGVYSNTQTVYASRIPSNISGDMTEGYILDCVPNEDACPNVFGMFVTEQGTCGRFYVDLNFNHELDNDEPGVPFAEILVEYEGYSEIVTCDVHGYFCITIPFALVTIQPLINGEPSMSVYPDNASDLYDSVVNPPPAYLFFGWIPPQDLQDVQISMTPLSAVVPGFETDYVVHVNNASSEDHAIQVNVTIDAMQDVIAVSNNGTESDSGVTWDLIIPAYGFVDLPFSVSNGVDLNLGDQITSWAVVQLADGFSDSNLDNNVVQLDMQVVGSYDPNNKLVNPAGIGLEGRIHPSVDSFEYTINFQNTGSAPAVNVRIVDELPLWLDASSIQMLQSSHPATMTVTGQHVEWVFTNIMLPDSTSNEPESHGHVAFRIGVTQPLIDGIVISNFASIYFDFNTPIITEPAILTVDETIGVANVEPVTALTVYPNPVSDDDLYIAGMRGTTDIFNASGQRVQTIQAQQAPSVISTALLAPGLYVVHDTTTGQRITFVKQ